MSQTLTPEEERAYAKLAAAAAELRLAQQQAVSASRRQSRRVRDSIKKGATP
ncbi:MAG: hypothetical protein HQ581_02540 [Planctomycetes bacterium]|nr:hypothetical protein [Planctomycetota bacterium]